LRTVTVEGVKRMLSVMSICTVRLTLAATPGLPMASVPWPPAWLPAAKEPVAQANIAQVAMNLIVFFMMFTRCLK
jgi:hypothetical protein